jgi:death on curing protein
MVEAFHADQLQQHGGGPGVRDEALLESALSRPRNRHASGEHGSCRLAAAYGYGLSSSRAFVDGNERVAFVAMAVFLRMNGMGLRADEPDVVETMWALADGRLSEDDLAEWLRERIEDPARVHRGRTPDSRGPGRPP